MADNKPTNDVRELRKARKQQSRVTLDAIHGADDQPEQLELAPLGDSLISFEPTPVSEFTMAAPVVMSATPVGSKAKFAPNSGAALQYKAVVAQCKNDGKLFRDESFPAAGDDDNSIVWKRALGELEEKPTLWGVDPQTGKEKKGPSPDDIIQGEVGDCWLLGAMAVLATKPDMLKVVFPDKQDWGHHMQEGKTHPGVFLFKFFKWGEWVEVLVDDRLPVKKSKWSDDKGKEPISADAFAYSRLGPNRAYWPLLLEKAYAKMHGSYECLAGGHASDAFVDFTGGVCSVLSLKSYTEKHLALSHLNDNKKEKKKVDPAVLKQAEQSLEMLWKRLKSANKSDRLISASISSGGGGGLRSEFKESQGLVLGHAYSVLDVRTIKEKGITGIFSDRLHLIKLRNPWGDSEWTGEWSDGDKAWDRVSKAEKKRLDLKEIDDGTFWMSYLDFITHFTVVRICRTFNTGFTSKWSLQKTIGSWPAGTSGGPRTATWGTNPQYCFDIESGSDTVEDTDAKGEGETKKEKSKVGTRVVMALAQRDYRLSVEAKTANLAMGLVVHRVQENRKHVLVHCNDYVYKASDCWINMREVALEFILPPGRYVIVPSASSPVDINTEHMLRLYSTGKTALKRLEKDEPPRASKLIGKGKPASAALSVKIVRAAGLAKVGIVRVADPYCTLRLNGKTYATRVQYDTLNPEWDEEFLFWFWGKKDIIKGKVLKLDVFDKNLSLDTHLGKIAIPLEEATRAGKRMRCALNLKGTVKKEPVHATILIELKLMVGLDSILMV
uniref:Calpain catalytic domain-containing protein n=1 Tax=Paramoeba aestuarina TaxID=180227 RepID=A0A7S4NRY4_9EUKA